MLPPDSLRDRIYAGFLGKAIGVRLGAPVESTVWTYERIRDTYGDITGYVRDYINFAADDDTNGPIYFIRAMRDYALQPTAQQVGKTWLNYAAEDHGMFWWGGYGVSTEHTGYKNLRAGIPAPQSGSISQNGLTVAEQIGGQIFIDSWGWVNPGNPLRAAEMSATAASVAHDGNALHGARFVAAMVADAFTASSVDKLFDTGMSVIPADSEYARVIDAVRDYHLHTPNDWRACREMLCAEFGYDRYEGICHIIPNAGVMALAMLYGEGDMPRTVEIATMCGWDTDCNAGNAGAIIGTFQGIQPNWDQYRTPINDIIIGSAVTGTLNIIDIPRFATELAVLAMQLNDVTPPDLWLDDMTRKSFRADFTLNGATHGMRVEGCNRFSGKAVKDGFQVQIDQSKRKQIGRVFWKPFYRRADFDDNRYRPMFSPLAATGQQVKMDVVLEYLNGDQDLHFVPYIKRAMSGQIDEIGSWQKVQKDQTIAFDIPETGDEAVIELGILVEYFGRAQYLGNLTLSRFDVSGAGKTRINPALEAEEWDAISRFTWNRGNWRLSDGHITGLTDSNADLWTGNSYARDQKITAKITPEAGNSHLLSLRAQGAERYYAAGFEDDCIVILAEDFGTEILAKAPFTRVLGQEYSICASAFDNKVTLSIDGKLVLEATDQRFAFGMSGIRMSSAGRISVGIIEIEEA